MLRTALVVGLVLSAGVVAYLALVLWNTWQTRRHVRRLRDEVSFSQWIEGVNREAVRRGYDLAREITTAHVIEWRGRWQRQLTPAEAASEWEEKDHGPRLGRAFDSLAV